MFNAILGIFIKVHKTMTLQPYLDAMDIKLWQLKAKTQVPYMLISDEAMPDAAQQLLNAMLTSIDLKKEPILTSPMIKKHLTKTQPRLILVLGLRAAHQLLNCDDAMDVLRHKIHTFDNIPLVVSHHPAYLLQHPKVKRQVYEDLYKVHTCLTNATCRSSDPRLLATTL